MFGGLRFSKLRRHYYKVIGLYRCHYEIVRKAYIVRLANKNMKKQTKVTQDKTQTRATIPKVFVDEFEVAGSHNIEWDNKGGKLKGELKKDGE